MAIARSVLRVIARSRRRRGNINGFAEGKRTMPGPGKKRIAFRHREERNDEAICKWAACNEAGLKTGLLNEMELRA
jgi:hypothetical protein